MAIPAAVREILHVAAPTLALALGGPLGPLAAALAKGALSQWLPRDASTGAPLPVTPAIVAEAIQRNADQPNFILALKQAEAELQRYEIEANFRFAELAAKDRQSSRDFQAGTQIAAPLLKWGMGIVVVTIGCLLAIVVGCLLMVAGIIRVPYDQAQLAVGVFGLIGAITGYLAGYGNQVLSFYFGSSSTEKSSSDQQAETLRDMGTALGEAAKTTPRPPAAAPAPTPPVVVVPTGPAAPAPPAPPGPPKPSRFIHLVERLLDHEGGYIDHPSDPGGCTNMGITIGTLGDWRGATVTCADVRSLTRDDAKEIYFAKYWNALRCDSLPPGLDYEVFDFGVNAGVGRSARALQTILARRDPSLKVDGVIGPLTLAALPKASPRALIEEFHAARMAHYRGLSTFATFGVGWTRRAEAVLADALAAHTAAAA